MFRKRNIATGCVTVVACAGAVVAPALARDGVPTGVSSFSWTDNEAGTDFFDGQIDSEEAKCLKRRRVALYRKHGGADPRIAGARTDGDGAFSIEREDPGSGRYYVKVKRRKAGDVSCKPTQTGLLQVTDLDGV